MAPLAVIADTRSPVDDAADHWAAELNQNGYVIIPRIVDPSLIETLQADLMQKFVQTPFCEGVFYGGRTKRFGRLLTQSPHAAQFIQHELVMAIVERILKPYCDTIQLNLTQALEVHPGQRVQVPHRDQDMWGGAKGTIEYLVNVMWPFTNYTQQNGATIVWPNSHTCPGDMLLPREKSFDAEMEPGSVLLFLGSTLHSAGANFSADVRRGMIISYCLGWLKPYENQWLSYPPEIARHFSPELAALVGYQQHRPNLGNFDGQCPSVLLKDNIPDHLHAIDELRPDQEQLIDDYYAGRLADAA
ncbi:MAG TPA: phytanoyl-CoA dioxygenase family protein [Sphingobium sp.]